MRTFEMQVSIENSLRCNANLVVWFLVQQSIQCLMACINACKIQIYRIEHLIISNTTLYDVVLFVRQTFTTCRDKIYPLFVVCFEYFVRTIGTKIV